MEIKHQIKLFRNYSLQLMFLFDGLILIYTIYTLIHFIHLPLKFNVIVIYC